MRKPEYLSFSSYSQWKKDVNEFYLRYLSDNRPPYVPQAPAAGVGSGFDARVKSELHSRLFGPGSDPAYEFEALYEKQVEPQNRDGARHPSEYTFECYKTAGFFDELLTELEQADGSPRFETRVDGVVNGVPIMGKPDLYWRRRNGLRVIHDWKVNGYYGKSNTSPNKGYRICRDSWDGRPSRSHNKSHALYKALVFENYDIDENYLEFYNTPWANQLSMYGWCLGETVGDETFVIQIHQITAKAVPDADPLLRVSEYRARSQRDCQRLLAKELQTCWDSIERNHIFSDMTLEASRVECDMLDKMSAELKPDDFFSEVIRPKFKGY
jgi:hypothetical protein